MSRWAWTVGAALVAVVGVAALNGRLTWHIPSLLVVAAGWIAAAIGVRREAGRLGLDGDRWGWVVLIFGWLGLAYWLVSRRRVSVPTPR